MIGKGLQHNWTMLTVVLADDGGFSRTPGRREKCSGNRTANKDRDSGSIPDSSTDFNRPRLPTVLPRLRDRMRMSSVETRVGATATIQGGENCQRAMESDFGKPD